MGAIADNIANVNTVGYKNAKVAFQTLVTKQASLDDVLRRRRAGAAAQRYRRPGPAAADRLGDRPRHLRRRLLRRQRRQPARPRATSTCSPAPVRSPRTPTASCATPPASTCRPGRPTPHGNVILPPGSTAALTNQNVISPDFLQTVDLNRVAVNAEETSEISIGANLAGQRGGRRHPRPRRRSSSIPSATPTRSPSRLPSPA